MWDWQFLWTENVLLLATFYFLTFYSCAKLKENNYIKNKWQICYGFYFLFPPKEDNFEELIYSKLFFSFSFIYYLHIYVFVYIFQQG